MDILDVFSWLPAKELSIDDIKKIVWDIEKRIPHEGYSVEYQLPPGADENKIEAVDELLSEGKLVCFLLKEVNIISVIGYKYR